MTLAPKLRQDFRAQAAEIEGVDLEVYQRHDKDPLEPIVGAGRADARVGFFGRDPGRDEVQHSEPFIGAGGQLLRRAIHEHLHRRPLPDFETSRALGRDFFWANTVPYKPLGNKAWSMKVKQRFHPPMRELLITQWQGRDLITLGREAFLWFGIQQPREARAEIDAFWLREDRFTSSLPVRLATAKGAEKTFFLHPLPHPSPLNATWYARFPALLKARLEQLDVRADNLYLVGCAERSDAHAASRRE